MKIPLLCTESDTYCVHRVQWLRFYNNNNNKNVNTCIAWRVTHTSVLIYTGVMLTKMEVHIHKNDAENLGAMYRSTTYLSCTWCGNDKCADIQWWVYLMMSRNGRFMEHQHHNYNIKIKWIWILSSYSIDLLRYKMSF